MGMKSLGEYYATKDLVEECHGSCKETVALEVLARAASGEEGPLLCPKHRDELLRQFVLDACILGVQKYTGECRDFLHDSEMVEYGYHQDEPWQQFILGEQDGEMKTTFKITITTTQEEW
jgi:hypothetical protein